MIISHKYKFIFIKTYKTAGTSIEVFLSQLCTAQDIITPILPPVEPHYPRNYEGFFNHIEAYKIRAIVNPHIWNTYYKFCVERNPWDKVLSYYYMMNFRENRKLSLDDYLGGGDYPINYPKYTEPGDPNQVIVDRVIYYETFIEELSSIFLTLGIRFNGSLGINAKSEYRIDHRPYQEIYTPEQANRVNLIFKHEIEMHGYIF